MLLMWKEWKYYVAHKVRFMDVTHLPALLTLLPKNHQTSLVYPLKSVSAIIIVSIPS